MKLRNKKTGEIVDLSVGTLYSNNNGGLINIRQFRDSVDTDKYSSLAELNKEWEDYEEPKKYYIYGDSVLLGTVGDFVEPGFKQIGNWFETKEEAEQAIEKLRALKRLKDAGFRFDGWQKIIEFNHGNITFKIDGNTNGEDLNLLFGGEK